MPSPGKRRTSFTVHDKLTDVKALEECNDISEVITTFYPNLSDASHESRRKLVLGWLHAKDQLIRQCAAKGGSGKKKARSLGVGTKLSAAAELEIIKMV